MKHGVQPQRPTATPAAHHTEAPDGGGLPHLAILPNARNRGKVTGAECRECREESSEKVNVRV